MIAHCVVFQTESTLFRFLPDLQTQVVCRVHPAGSNIAWQNKEQNVKQTYVHDTFVKLSISMKACFLEVQIILWHVKQCNSKQTEKADRACGTQVDKPVLPCSMFYFDGVQAGVMWIWTARQLSHNIQKPNSRNCFKRHSRHNLLTQKIDSRAWLQTCMTL